MHCRAPDRDALPAGVSCTAASVAANYSDGFRGDGVRGDGWIFVVHEQPPCTPPGRTLRDVLHVRVGARGGDSRPGRSRSAQARRARALRVFDPLEVVSLEPKPLGELRHTFALHLVMRGAVLKSVQELLATARSR